MDRRTGRLLVSSGLYNLTVTVICVGLLVVLANVTAVNGALVGALTQQRDQFQACKNKPPTTAGCTTPVAAEPSVIVKQGGRGLPGLPGVDGVNGLNGRDGVDGRDGKNGVTPPCMRTPRQCVGADGRAGTDGADGADGADGTDGADGRDGKDGITPACWFEASKCRGAQGLPGNDGANGYSVTDQDCLGDGADSFWRVYLSNGTDQKTVDAQGPCRTGPAPSGG